MRTIPTPSVGRYSRAFGFEWERGQGAHTYGEYEERLRELGEKAERVARRAAEQAQRYAERAANRARETDWEAVGREVRTAVERAMHELEDAFAQVRTDWETHRPGGGGGASTSGGGARPSAQRVRIEQDDVAEPTAAAPVHLRLWRRASGSGPGQRYDR